MQHVSARVDEGLQPSNSQLWCSLLDASLHAAVVTRELGAACRGQPSTHDLLLEIDVLRLQALLFVGRLDPGPTDFLRFESRLVCLKSDIAFGIHVIYAEVVRI